MGRIPPRRAEAIPNWFTSKARLNLREGGRYSNADGDHGEFRVILPEKRLTFTWENAKHCPGSTVELRLYRKPGKTQVVVEHAKLPDRKGAEEMKEGWSWALDSLRSYLETGVPVKWEEWRAKRVKARS